MVMILPLIGTPFLLIISTNLIVMFGFKKHDPALKAILDRAKKAPLLGQGTKKILLVPYSIQAYSFI